MSFRIKLDFVSKSDSVPSVPTGLVTSVQGWEEGGGNITLVLEAKPGSLVSCDLQGGSMCFGGCLPSGCGNCQPGIKRYTCSITILHWETCTQPYIQGQIETPVTGEGNIERTYMHSWALISEQRTPGTCLCGGVTCGGDVGDFIM